MASTAQADDQILYEDEDCKHVLCNGQLLSYKRHRDNGHYAEDVCVYSRARYGLGKYIDRLQASYVKMSAKNDGAMVKLLSILGVQEDEDDSLGQVVARVAADMTRLREENAAMKEQVSTWRKAVANATNATEVCRSVIGRSLHALGSQGWSIKTPETLLMDTVKTHMSIVSEGYTRRANEVTSLQSQLNESRTQLNESRKEIDNCRTIIRKAAANLWSSIPMSVTPESALLDVVDETVRSVTRLNSSIEANRAARATYFGTGEDEAALRETLNGLKWGLTGLTLFERATLAAQRLRTYIADFGDLTEEEALRKQIRTVGQSDDMPLLQAARLTIAVLASKLNDAEWAFPSAALAAECGLLHDNVSELRTEMAAAGVEANERRLIVHASHTINVLRGQLTSIKKAREIESIVMTKPTPFPPGTYDMGNGLTWIVGPAWVDGSINANGATCHFPEGASIAVSHASQGNKSAE